MSFMVLFSSRSYKAVKSFDKDLVERVRRVVLEIEEDPWHIGTIKIQGHQNARRKRVGDYRIVYHIDRAQNEVLIAFIVKRDDVTYKF